MKRLVVVVVVVELVMEGLVELVMEGLVVEELVEEELVVEELVVEELAGLAYIMQLDFRQPCLGELQLMDILLYIRLRD